LNLYKPSFPHAVSGNLYEIYKDSIAAIIREKRLKKWKRQWKIKLIEDKNPMWKDLSRLIHKLS
jgi:predicted GIY-YIG superfamily endonuclease